MGAERQYDLAACRTTWRVGISVLDWQQSAAARSQDRSEWAHKTLGVFLSQAKEFADTSKFLAKEVGANARVRIAEKARSELRINRYGVFEGVIFLDIHGSNGGGQLLVTVCENHENRPKIDLFAMTPRAIDFPLKLKNPSWTPRNGKQIYLNSRTGDPKRR